MILLSFNYFIFLGLTFFLYYFANNSYKHWVIFFASLFFLSSISINALLFSLLFTGFNYFGGLLLYKHKENSNFKKFIFWLLIGSDIGILIFYKYINFIFENINYLFDIVQAKSEIGLIDVILPIGISYYTFQAIGYLIRIDRDFEVPEKNFIQFTNFLLFFPKFLSGPVERSNHFLPQINNLKRFNQVTVSDGLRLILVGAFKKIIIAENLYVPVNTVYSNVHNYSGTPILAVFFLQLIYIYCDFSGYTDIALGSAKLFGINIMDNFKRPFLSKTITEFWKRWHISLSSWCNEFIYLPFIIKYRKLGNIASVFGIFLTFLIIGIWHGANWTFVILGLLQALAIVYEFFTKRYRLKFASYFPKWITNTTSRILVYVYMSISMVFFFSNSVSDAWYFLTHLFVNIEFQYSGYDIINNKFKFLLSIGCFIILFMFEIMNERGYGLQKYFVNKSRWIRWTIYYIIIIIIFLYNSKISDFVYMSF
jgi:D-alanyl-lipoteichoic acid acyltransferase DltB (MBOAT superfamily)